MVYKVKRIFKGLKAIYWIFGKRAFLSPVKEHEMEIGYPTDVEHVAQISWDTKGGSASPSWLQMDDVASSDLSLATLQRSLISTEQRVGAVSENTGRRDDAATCPDVPSPPRKPERKKRKDGSPSRLSSSSKDEVASLPSTAAHVDAAPTENAAR